MGIISIASMIGSTFKTGCVMYSLQSYDDKKPKFEIDRRKVKPFLGWWTLALLTCFLYAFLLTSNVESIFYFCALSMAFITYFLVYWVLLKEKPHNEK